MHYGATVCCLMGKLMFRVVLSMLMKEAGLS